MPVQRAKVEQHQADLNGDFGKQLLMRKFNDVVGLAVLEALPKYVRGPKKGQVKAWIHWKKVTVGGWYRDEQNPQGGVMLPGTQDVRITLDYAGLRTVIGALDRRGFAHEPNAETDQQFISRIKMSIENQTQRGR